MRSGSFAIEGAGEYVVTAVGPDSYAEESQGRRVASGIRAPRSSARSTGS